MKMHYCNWPKFDVLFIVNETYEVIIMAGHYNETLILEQKQDKQDCDETSFFMSVLNIIHCIVIAF